MTAPAGLLRLRLLSLFHVPLPLVLLWMVADYGYDPRGLAGALLLAAVVLPASRLAGSGRENINWTYGLGQRLSTWPAAAYLPALWAGFAIACAVALLAPVRTRTDTACGRQILSLLRLPVSPPGRPGAV